MASWHFRAFSSDSSMSVPLSAQQEERIPVYHQAMESACGSDVANPIFTGFRVRGSMGGKPAGNIEYGLGKALHCELFGGGAFRSSQTSISMFDVPVFGLVSSGKRAAPTPCGDCRDFLFDEFGPELETVYGRPEGGAALVIPLSAYLVGEHPVSSVIGIDRKVLENTLIATWRKGNMLANDPFTPDGRYDRRKYAASVVASHGHFFGARSVPSDFHSLYSLEDAIRAAERAGGTFLLEVFVAGEGDGTRPPDVMYRDRQHLHHFNLQAELVLGREQDPVVHLATIADGQVTGLWRTTVKDWFPQAFSARNFADMARLEAYYKQRFPR